MKRPSTHRALIVATLAMVAITGCGGDDEEAEIDAEDAAYCAVLGEFITANNATSALLDSASAPGLDEAESTFTSYRTNLDAFAAAAPAEISADVDAVASAFGSFIDAVVRNGYDLVALSLDPEFAATSEQLGSPEIAAAQDRIDEFNQSTCGVTIGA